MKCYRLAIINLALLLCIQPLKVRAQAADPVLLNFDEIKRLYQDDDLPAQLRDKLRTLLTTPFVRNTASDGGAMPLMAIIVAGRGIGAVDLPALARQFRGEVAHKFGRGVDLDVDDGLEDDQPGLMKASMMAATMA